MAELKGVREALETLRKLPDHIAPKGGGPIRRSLWRASKPWLDQAKSNASTLGPGNHQRGNFSIVGRLKDNIIRSRDPDPESNGFSERVIVTYAGRIYWGAFVEAGTEKQAAQPFLRPAPDQVGDEPIRLFARTFRREVDNAVKRAKA